MIFGVVPMITAVIYSSQLASNALVQQSFSQLQAIQSVREKDIELFFHDRLIGIEYLSTSYRVQEFTSDLVENGTNSSALINRTASLNHFEQYITNYNYSDFLILSANKNTVLYSLNNGAYEGKTFNKQNDPALYDAWEQSQHSTAPIFSDFKPDFSLNNQEVAYFSSPILDADGQLLAILAVKVMPELITQIVDSRVGMGETGESYLIGVDKLDDNFDFRSDLETMGKGKYRIGYRLPKPVDYWGDARQAGENGGQGVYIDSASSSVLVTYAMVRVPGVEWYLISKINEGEVTESISELYQAVLVAGGALVLILVFISMKFSRSVTNPLIDGMHFAQDIAKGELSANLLLKRKDEIGDLAEALNDMASQLRELDWLKSGKEQLDDRLRGDLDLLEISNRFITFFTKHMNSQLGALYLFDDDLLHLKATYAFSDRKGNFNQIKLGEGMVGQAGLENEVIIFSGVSQGAPVLNYGAGEQLPEHFMAIPLATDEGLIGVVLIGSLTPYSPLQKRFVNDVVQNAAVLFNAANSRLMIEELLEQAQLQKESLSKANIILEEQTFALRESEQALQTQQEELRVTNEELEEQTKVLKESESELQAQQEELRVTNEELEERTKALEDQKLEMQKKNEALSEAQEVVEEKAKELEIASKYKSEFLANMSHELRTPLNSILILSQLFANNKDGNLSNRQIESAKAINSSGSDLLSLINEILDLSKVEAGKVDLHIENVDFTNIETDLNRLYRDIAIEKDLDFQITVAPNLPEYLETDSQRLQQVIRNLLTNAFKFTHEGCVSLNISQPSPELIKRANLPREKLVAFSVKDEGIGIKKEKQLAIFQAFQQADGSTSRNYGGTGLGLSISKELTKLLGGFIHLLSDEGKGSTFTVVLPLNYSHADTPEAKEVVSTDRPVINKVDTPPLKSADKPQDELPLAKINERTYVQDDRHSIDPEDQSLLIIEDDGAFAGVMRDFGRERGFKCIVAENGETGLHFADYYKPSAIILDIGLPGIDGWTVMERLKENPNLRHIPVHFMSASDANLDAMRMGAIGYLTKPVDMKKLDRAFSNIEEIISKPVKRLLIVEDDEIQRESIKQLIGEEDIHIVTASTGEKALSELESNRYDCMILDLGLEDMTGFELLEEIRRSESAARVPIIVYTGRELTVEEEKELHRYAESIIIKGVKSPERLLDESALFLHRVEANLPAEQRGMLKAVHDKESVLNSKKVLLVDDDMRNVFALSSILEDKGMEIVVARDGLESLDKLKNHPDTDLVLMDIMMPKMDGYEAMKRIRSQKMHNKLPVIALTAKAMKGDRSKCIESGASDYLAKPIDTDKLLSMLRVWLY